MQHGSIAAGGSLPGFQSGYARADPPAADIEEMVRSNSSVAVFSSFTLVHGRFGRCDKSHGQTCRGISAERRPYIMLSFLAKHLCIVKICVILDNCFSTKGFLCKFVQLLFAKAIA